MVLVFGLFLDCVVHINQTYSQITNSDVEFLQDEYIRGSSKFQ